LATKSGRPIGRAGCAAGPRATRRRNLAVGVSVGGQIAMVKAAPKRKIVIVDDDRPTREMLQTALELEGYDTTQAANGLRLLSILHIDRPDVVLLDVMMSWIDGFELCRSIKQNDELRHIPIIFISGKVTDDDVQRGFACGAIDYFKKPLDMERLLQRIREIVEHPNLGSV
jgi:PleD family two-component response regulator